MRDESEKEVIHRLEAFSDIVIGFSLAQLGLTLTIPAHARDLFTHIHGATSLMGLVITFTLVCGVWWSHHRLFRHLFVPTTINIVANFAALGGVIFLAYSMQVLLHFGFGDPVAFPMYTGAYAWILLLFSFIAWNGMRLRSRQMHAELRSLSLLYTIRLSVVALYLTLMTVAVLVFGLHSNVSLWMFAALVVVVAVSRILARRLISSPSV